MSLTSTTSIRSSAPTPQSSETGPGLGSRVYDKVLKAADKFDAAERSLPEPIRKVGYVIKAPIYFGSAGALLGGFFGTFLGALGGPVTAVVAGLNGAVMGGGIGTGVGAAIGAAALRR